VKIFIAGDLYFKPGVVIDIFQDILKDVSVPIEYDSITLPYPIDHIPLTDNSIIPTGMAWDNNMDEDYGAEGVCEYYGRSDALKGLLGNCDILVIHGAALPPSIINEAPKLKVICCMRGGPVNIAADYAREKGIVLINSPGKNAQGVAEYTIGIILAHIRHIPQGYNGLFKNQYIQRFNQYDVLAYELEHKRIGIVGFGRIGQALSKILGGFGCDICTFDPNIDPQRAVSLNAKPLALKELLKTCDIISLHARGAGKPLIGAAEFSIMKSSALFVNTARGTLVDYPALADALKAKKIAGAILDVFGLEPFSFYKELISLPQVTAAPHMAGTSRETVARGSIMVAEDIKRFIAGEPLKHLVK
jgi:D-3-phosphoglycerate dehydrogenase